MKRTTLATAINRPEFHRALADFLESGSATVGDARFGHTPWVWVKHLGHKYYLNADSTAVGVAAYLSLVEAAEGDLLWSVLENATGQETKAAFGPDQAVVQGFYLYRQV